jgi:DNA-binding beta-propeller fold protein YncE
MERSFYSNRKGGLVLLLSLVAVVATWVIASGIDKRAELSTDLQLLARKPTGSAQLVSIEPFPETDGEMCQWTAVAASSPLAGELAQERIAALRAPSTADTGVENSVTLDRAPVRSIRDPNPSFSAIAVEPNSNMLAITDENLFRVMEYNRNDNTPPSAKMTEPKRIVGGNRTKAEMLCGVYIDPKTLDMYVVNNDTQDWLAIFSKNAQGNVPPDRVLAVPHGTFGIAVDEEKQELFLTVQHNNEVVVYRKTASGNEKPLRELMGDDTHLEDPHGVALDTKNNLMFVTNHGNVAYRGKDPSSPRRYIRGSGKFDPPSITVFPADAKGNTPPLRVISGPRTGLNWPMQITVDQESGEIYVANDMDHSIEVFQISDQGDVVPTRIIKGPKTLIKNPTGVAIDLKNKELWVANMGNHTASVFPLAANGNVAPKRSIRGGPADELSLMIGNPGAVGYDSKRDQILVPN